MKPTEEQLSIINSRLPGTKLSPAQVEVLPFRVFDNAVTDRFTVMSPEMMAKVAKDLNEGRSAFNKLHEARYALPVGRSVNGKVVTVKAGEPARGHAAQSMLQSMPGMDPGRPKMEVHANMYAVVQNMDGSPALDGKEIADKYNTGAVYACSAGVTVGFYKCNCCGNDIRDWQNCEHSLGKTYMIDEKPVQCMALMTGHDIQNGVAMDCGCYEVSAVTAGGVANAGVLTETFGKYSEGTDIQEFKKGAFADTKEFQARVTFEAFAVDSAPESTNERMTTTMALEEKDVKALIESQFGTIHADKVRLETEMKHLDEKYQAATTDLTTARGTIETLKSEAAAQVATFATEKETLTNEFAAERATLTAEKDAYTAEKAGLVAFRDEYINGVFELGNKIGKTDAIEVYAAKSLEELKTLRSDYSEQLNSLFPTGRQTNGDVELEETYSGIPDSAFKTDK